MNFLKFIFSHSIFIAICAMALGWKSFELLNQNINQTMLWFIFFSTLASYNLYWIVSKVFIGHQSLNSVFKSSFLQVFIAFSSSLVAAYLLLKLPPQSIVWVFLGGVTTVLYAFPLLPFGQKNQLNKLGFLKPVMLSIAWVLITVCLPLSVMHPQKTEVVITLVCYRFFLLLMLCALFDLRDARKDKVLGLTTLGTQFGARSSQIFMRIAMAFYIFTGVLVATYFFDKYQIIAHLLMCYFVWRLYILATQKERGYYFYYFLVDGMMLISAILTYLAGILNFAEL